MNFYKNLFGPIIFALFISAVTATPGDESTCNVSLEKAPSDYPSLGPAGSSPGYCKLSPSL
ncbi:hypothetical protein CROQUDRAFT_735774, partial [Cronartium quercuum f. sp. fusiforme G11]